MYKITYIIYNTCSIKYILNIYIYLLCMCIYAMYTCIYAININLILVRTNDMIKWYL